MTQQKIIGEGGLTLPLCQTDESVDFVCFQSKIRQAKMSASLLSSEKLFAIAKTNNYKVIKV
jgi:hypothetical protein